MSVGMLNLKLLVSSITEYRSKGICKRLIRFLSHRLGKLGVTYGLYGSLEARSRLPICDN